MFSSFREDNFRRFYHPSEQVFLEDFIIPKNRSSQRILLSLREGIFRRSYHPSEKLFSREVIIPQ
jgi:hypothetical protein